MSTEKPSIPHWPCECVTWCRTDIRFKDGKPLPMTRHHPRCQHVDASLIDVWRVQTPGDPGGCIVETEAEAREMAASEYSEEQLEVTPERMHREVFEALEEFAGF